MTALPRIRALSTARPSHDIHAAFIGWAEAQITDPRAQAVFRRMASRSGIDHRYAVLPPTPQGGSPVSPGGFYAGPPPGTAARMALYADYAPALALEAIKGLKADVRDVTHLIVASCTGFVAPGVDQILARQLNLSPDVERKAKVLVVTVELSCLHLNATQDIESLLAMLQFGDGAAAALVTGEGPGLALYDPFATTLPDSAGLIRWDIGDTGFVMHLSGKVPSLITQALQDEAFVRILAGGDPQLVDGWAVHAGGRSILDAVEHGLRLDPAKLAASRSILREGGNMSSATLMFVLARYMQQTVDRGVALAFGPGVAAEGFRFRTVA